jgi:hypothetical protein
MGGNALKSVETRRINRGEFEELSKLVGDRLIRAKGIYAVVVVPSYAEKETFGDIDILVLQMETTDMVELVKDLFKPKEIFKNGNIISFDFRDVQIDLICNTNSKTYTFSYHYFAYNDLGNFMGRTAHRMGFKFGHDGLWYEFRDPENESRLYRSILVTNDIHEAFRILDYDMRFWGSEFFKTPEDIYAFAESSKYFDPKSFILNNRSYAARVRDSKRKMYSGMLKYLTKKYNLTDDLKPEPLDKNEMLEMVRAKMPTFDRKLDQAISDLALDKAFKEKFNGNLISEHFKVEGKELGELMAILRKHIEKHGSKEQVSKMSKESAILYFQNILKGEI